MNFPRRKPLSGNRPHSLDRMVLCALLLLSPWTSGGTLAQDPGGEPGSASPSAKADKRPAIEEIFVTATKREKSAREIPVSVDAFSADDINLRGGQGAQDALLFSPGVSVNQYLSPNLVNVQIRGVTADTVTPVSGGSPTGVFLDEVPLGNPTLIGSNPNIDAFDLATIEVLKGPQGTLFGGSALAGALRSIPNRPQLDAISIDGFYSSTNYELSNKRGKDYGLAVNLPLGDSLALRGMATERDYPGTVDSHLDGLSDTDNYRVTQDRLMLLWQPTETLSIQAMRHEGDGDVNDALYTDNTTRHERSNESGLSPINYNFRINQLSADYAFEHFNLHASASNLRKLDDLIVQVDRVLGGQMSFRESTSSQQISADIDTAELRLVSAAPSESSWALFDNWDWLVGAFRLRGDQDFLGVIAVQLGLPLPQSLPLPDVLPGLPSLEATNLEATSTAEETAYYFDLTRYFGEHWELNLGGRQFEQNSVGSSTSTNNGLTLNSVAGVQEDKGFNPKVALTWRATEDFSLRAAAIKGFRFGGVNVILDNDPNAPPFYTSDELWNYEIGMRSDWLDQRLRIDLTAFYVDWSRAQISQRTFTGISSYIENVGSAISKGAELQTTMILPADFRLTLSTAYVDARTNAEFNGASGTVPSGRRMPGTPRVTASAILGYQTLFWRKVFDASLTWNYQGSTFNTLYKDNEIPSYAIVGLHLGITFPEVSGQPVVSLNIANLLDERTYNGVSPAISAIAVENYYPIRPRSVAARISFSF